MYSVKKGKPEDFVVAPVSKYPFDKLKPGYYFEIPAADEGARINAGGSPKVSYAVSKYQKSTGTKLSVRKDKKTGNIRVFCVA